MNVFKHLTAIFAGLSCAAAVASTDFVDLLGDVTIEDDEFARSVELREAQRTLVNPDDTIWETIRRGFGIADLPNSVVDKELKLYTRALPYTQQMAFRARMYLYFIVSETQKRGMPANSPGIPLDLFHTSADDPPV